MKIQCNVCEAAEANVLCCADEAALCWACDDKVHAANKLASKHQRVPLSNSSSPQFPKCDICQVLLSFTFTIPELLHYLLFLLMLLDFPQLNIQCLILLVSLE
ncbi:B-box zinc finger protein 22 [Linum perenne]